jgi:hypothetical protein
MGRYSADRDHFRSGKTRTAGSLGGRLQIRGGAKRNHGRSQSAMRLLFTSMAKCGDPGRQVVRYDFLVSYPAVPALAGQESLPAISDTRIQKQDSECLNSAVAAVWSPALIREFDHVSYRSKDN